MIAYNSFIINSNDNTNYLYTKGGLFSLGGKNYIGEYHYYAGIPRTGPTPSNDSKTLQKPYTNQDAYVYDRITEGGSVIQTFIEPVPHIFTVTESDYVSGFVLRYFVQKHTTSDSYTIELDQQQYSLIQKPGGIDGGLYNKQIIRWKLTGYEAEIREYNRGEVLGIKSIIPGIEYSIKNYTEHARITYF